MTTVAPITVDCPYCGADAGTACVTSSGKRRHDRPHAARIDKAEHLAAHHALGITAEVDNDHLTGTEHDEHAEHDDDSPITVDCPHCGADAGEPCVTSSGDVVVVQRTGAKHLTDDVADAADAAVAELGYAADMATVTPLFGIDAEALAAVVGEAGTVALMTTDGKPSARTEFPVRVYLSRDDTGGVTTDVVEFHVGVPGTSVDMYTDACALAEDMLKRRFTGAVYGVRDVAAARSAGIWPPEYPPSPEDDDLAYAGETVLEHIDYTREATADVSYPAETLPPLGADTRITNVSTEFMAVAERAVRGMTGHFYGVFGTWR